MYTTAEPHMNEKFCALIKISLRFVLKAPIENNAALALIMAWGWIGHKPLSEPIGGGGLRCSSHILHIEKGRYTRPRTPLHERLCYSCNCVEDELHFVTACSLNRTERIVLYDKVARKFPEFDQLADVEKFVFLFTFKDAQMLTWLGKFLYKSFRTKSSQWNEYILWKLLRDTRKNGGVEYVAASGPR